MPSSDPAGSRSLRGEIRGLLAGGFLRQVAATFGTRVLLVGVGVVTSVLTARALGPAGRGEYALAGALLATGVQFGNLGLHASNTYRVARDRSLLSTLLANTIVVSLGAGGAAALLAWIVFTLHPGWAPVAGALLAAALLAIPLGLANLLLQNLVLGVGDVRAYNAMEVVGRLLGVALLGLVILSRGVTPLSVFVTTLATFLASTLWAGAVLARRHGAKLAAPSAPLARACLGYGLKAYSGSLLAWLALRVDLFIVSSLLDKTAVGNYSMAVSVADLLYLLPATIGTILFPRLAAMPSDAARWAAARRVLLAMAGLMVPLLALATLLARPAVLLLYGELFLPAVAPLLVLTAAVLLRSADTVVMNYFASVGMPVITVIAPAAGLVATVALDLLLIPRWGISGAAAAQVLSIGLMLSLSLAYRGRFVPRESA